jgi:hypothetical protein
MRRLVRLGLLVVLIGSLAATGFGTLRVLSDPTLTAIRTAAAAEIIAATDTMLATNATPERLAALIEVRLQETPRNWLALDALTDLVAERGIALPVSLLRRVSEARADDFSLLSQASACALCAYDPAQCSLSQVMMCQAPVALTPVGDIAGVTRAGVAYVSGEPIDQIDLALSVVGLGATAVVLASGGTSVVVKAGASLAKLARRMGRVSPRLAEMAIAAAKEGVDWAALPAARSVDDISAAIRAEAFAPLTATLTDLERLRAATDATTALHLLPLVDDAKDASSLAAAAEALGPRLIGRAEVLGKTRLFRTTLRVSETAWALISGLSGLLLSLAALMGSALQSYLFRILRRRAKAA